MPKPMIAEAGPADTAGDSGAERCTGEVLAVGAEGITVRVSPRPGCGACARGVGCGQALGLRRRAAPVFTVAAPEAGPPPAVGSEVALLIEPRRVLAAAVAGYGYPLAGLLVAVLVATAAGAGDAGAALAALPGLLAGLWLGRREAQRQAARLRPRLAPAAAGAR